MLGFDVVESVVLTFVVVLFAVLGFASMMGWLK